MFARHLVNYLRYNIKILLRFLSRPLMRILSPRFTAYGQQPLSKQQTLLTASKIEAFLQQQANYGIGLKLMSSTYQMGKMNSGYGSQMFFYQLGKVTAKVTRCSPIQYCTTWAFPPSSVTFPTTEATLHQPTFTQLPRMKLAAPLLLILFTISLTVKNLLLQNTM